MNFFFKTWVGRIVAVFALTIILTISGRIIDPAYFENPLGEGVVGIKAEENYDLPATSEIAVMVDGQDPLRIDFVARTTDISGTIEVLAPDGSMVFSDRLALRHYPNTFMPNHARWQTFNVPARKKGQYSLRLTQEQFGEARVFFYQGPFVMRLLVSVPLVAAFLVLVVSVTISKKPEPELLQEPQNEAVS